MSKWKIGDCEALKGLLYVFLQWACIWWAKNYSIENAPGTSLRPRPVIRFQTKTELFAPFSKRFGATLIVFVSFSPAHTTTPHPFWKRFYTLNVHAQMNSTHAYFNISACGLGARSCLFWWRHRIQIASFSSSTLENSIFKKHRFQIAPL